MKKRIANLISNVTNPFLMSLVLILLLSFKLTSNIPDAVRWSLISIAVSILPVFLIIVYLVRSGRLDTIFTNVRGQRTKIYLLASACIGIGCVILCYLGAPSMLVATFVAGFSGLIVFMCINLFWKISLHTAFITASVIALIILYGPIVTVTAVLIPLVGWAKIELKHHSLTQTATGALIAALVIIVVLYLFGFWFT
ncbi:phosphatidic acid phosphatase [Chloroflexota bacterium]